MKAVFLGICGYLLKEASAAEIIAAVRAAVRGEATCPPSLCMHLGSPEQKEPREAWAADAQNGGRKILTPRQLQLLRLVAQGMTNKEIAKTLNLSQFTVKNHLRRSHAPGGRNKPLRRRCPDSRNRPTGHALARSPSSIQPPNNEVVAAGTNGRQYLTPSKFCAARTADERPNPVFSIGKRISPD